MCGCNGNIDKLAIESHTYDLRLPQPHSQSSTNVLIQMANT